MELKEIGKINVECEAAKKLKIDAQFVKEANLPFKINGAVKFNNQAQFNPLKFLECISQDRNRQRFHVYINYDSPCKIK